MRVQRDTRDKTQIKQNSIYLIPEPPQFQNQIFIKVDSLLPRFEEMGMGPFKFLKTRRNEMAETLCKVVKDCARCNLLLDKWALGCLLNYCDGTLQSFTSGR